MNLKVTNENYCASIVELKEFITLEGKDKIQGTLIFNNHIIIQKDLKLGDVGIFFPVESKINAEFLKNNNLFKDKELNKDTNIKGFFEQNCRVKCLKLSGFKSEGFFIPLKSIDYLHNSSEFKVGDEFNEIDDTIICTKYIIRTQKHQTSSIKKPKKHIRKFNKVIENQFNFHIDTPLLNKNIWRLNPNDTISITSKLHGTSAIFSNTLTNRKLNIIERLLKKLSLKIQTTNYDNLYASRTIIKNKYLNENKQQSYYEENIWEIVNKEIQEHIPTSFTIYGEIVGYLSTNTMIQKGYHYGCKEGCHKLYVYRITTTNSMGIVTELSWHQIKQFCLKHDLSHVPEFYYGLAKDCFDIIVDDNWNTNFIKKLSMSFCMNDSMCEMNNKEVPSEGVVLRVDNLFSFDAYKLKNFAFKAMETAQLDKGIIDIESAQ